MDGLTRRHRFETRVQTERAFLTAINSVFGEHAPLAGMTVDAIQSWRRRAAAAIGKDVSSLAEVLLEASMRADLMADNSKDVFEPEERPAPNSIAELGGILAVALDSYRSTVS